MTATRDIWVIGDVQGCCSSLDRLLAQPEIAENPESQFWFAGDLVNRGPDSLGSLQRIIGLGERAIAILGNHDLHLLAVAAGIRRPSKSDTIDDVLNAPNADELIDWLRRRPLAHYDRGHLLVHAGVLPQWDVDKTLSLAAEVQAALSGPDWAGHLAHMYGNKPARWRDTFSGNKRLRAIINALTRMRLCNEQGKMEFSHKGPPKKGDGLLPWFDVPGRATANETVVFGHWSALGLLLRPTIICLDSGCVWGRKLTALRLRDRKIVQVDCPAHQTPRTA